MYKSLPLSEYELYKIASVSPAVAPGNPLRNADHICDALSLPEISDASVIVLPELCVTGYTCGDLFFQEELIRQSITALKRIALFLKDDSRLVALGAPLMFGGSLYNCAVFVHRGRILGAIPKTYIPNYQEFYEKRWFRGGKDIFGETILIDQESVPFGSDIMISYNGVKVSAEICEDLWVPVPPSSHLCQAGAEIILNLSATDDNIGKYGYIKDLVVMQSARCRAAYAYSSAGHGESSTDLVFSGINLIACDGSLLGEGPRFSNGISFATAIIDIEKLRNDRRKYNTFYPESPVQETIGIRTINTGNVDLPSFSDKELSIVSSPFIPSDREERESHCREIINIQSEGLAQRLRATGCKNIVVGISGGLDSTLAILIAHNTFSKLGIPISNIHSVTMPATATSSRTLNNARKLMEGLGTSVREIPIKEAVELHFQSIGHDPDIYNAVYENSQARERTQILMDLANKFGGMVLGTGDMSELALGWCTYNGDQMSMYNVNGGIPKTLVKYLVSWFAENKEYEGLKTVLQDIIDTPISPELVPSAVENEISQKTEDLVGPYELHDFFLFHFLRNSFRPSKIMFMAVKAFHGAYTPEEIKHWLTTFYRRFFNQQFKRSCMPDGPKVGSVCLSPRGDWRMPSDVSPAMWIKEIEDIEV